MTETVADMAERIAVEEQYANATIHQRMIAILGELPAIGKDAFNTQQKFHYRSHDDVLNALNPLLAKYGVFVVPTVLERVPNERTTQRGTTMYEVNLLVSYTFYGATGDSITATAWGEGTDAGDKSTNKAMTMAFKNVLAQVFAVSTGETIDADGGSPEETRRGAPPGAPREERQPRDATKVFDPGHDLLPDAPRGEGFKQKIATQLEWIRPDVDWPASIGSLPGERDPQFYTRLSNATTRLYAQTEGKDFPPLSDELVKSGFGWAYEGAAIELVFKPREKDEGDDPAPLTPEEAAAMQAALDNDDIDFGPEDEPPSNVSGTP